MVHTRKSEYDSQFKKSPTKYVSQDFEQKLGYRIQRRKIENSHFQFDWDNQSNVSSSECLNVEEKVAKAIPHKNDADPPHVKKHKEHLKKYDEKKKEYESQPSEVEAVQTENQPPTDIVTKSKKERSDEAVEEQPKKRNNRGKNAVENLEVQKVEIDIKPKRPQRPFRQKKSKKTSKQRPKSAPAKSSSENVIVQASKENHPFLGFGNGDKERETGHKRTYNIRAPCDVYPSALRALKRREYDIKKRQERARSAPLRLKRKTALFNEKMARETSMWDTEYRNHFVGYSENEYKRNLSARLPH